MAIWDEKRLKDEQCPKCGAIYQVIHKKLPLKDKDEFKCQCGYIMRSWKETGMYSYRAIESGK